MTPAPTIATSASPAGAIRPANPTSSREFLVVRYPLPRRYSRTVITGDRDARPPPADAPKSVLKMWSSFMRQPEIPAGRHLKLNQTDIIVTGHDTRARPGSQHRSPASTRSGACSHSATANRYRCRTLAVACVACEQAPPDAPAWLRPDAATAAGRHLSLCAVGAINAHIAPDGHAGNARQRADLRAWRNSRNRSGLTGPLRRHDCG